MPADHEFRLGAGYKRYHHRPSDRPQWRGHPRRKRGSDQLRHGNQSHLTYQCRRTSTGQAVLQPGMYEVEVSRPASRRPCATPSKSASPTASTSTRPGNRRVGAAGHGDHRSPAAQHRERLAGHRDRFQARGQPAALLRQSVPADRTDRRRDLQRQRPAWTVPSSPPTSSTSPWAERAAT